MAHVLKQLLGNDHPLFTLMIMQLERAAGDVGVDIPLIADITEKAHEVLRELGLDPADSHGREVYNALIVRIKAGHGGELLDGKDYVLLDFNDDIVSFNVQDVVENAHHELPYEQRTSAHGLRHLRAEIIRRYAEHDRTDNELVHKLAEEIGLKPSHDEGHPTMDTEQHDEQSGKPRVLAIGDIFTDAFIKLNEDVARIDTDENGEKRISLPLGTKPPYDQVDIVQAVGPAPNAAVAVARLGLDVSLDSFIGDDEVGKEAIAYLNQQHVETEDMLVEQGIKTSYYFVLRYGAERTILVKNEQFDYKWDPPVKKPDWVYLALISDASWRYHEGLLAYLKDNPEIKLAFQPGTFHFKWGVEKLAEIYRRTHIIILNREEAVDITGRSYDSIRDLANGLHDLGPHIVVITDGPNGSYASYDFKLVTIPNYPDPAPPLDRTGAGDAFASTIVAALAMGETMDTALTWAPINSMSVVQELGAQKGLLSLEKLKKYLASAPEDYKLTDVSE